MKITIDNDMNKDLRVKNFETITARSILSLFIYNMNLKIKEDSSLTYLESFNNHLGISTALQTTGDAIGFIRSGGDDNHSNIYLATEDKQSPFFGRLALYVSFSKNIWDSFFPDMSSNEQLTLVLNMKYDEKILFIFKMIREKEILILKKERSCLFVKANAVTKKIKGIQKLL